VSAVFLELFGIPILFVEQNSPVFLIMVFGVVALVIGMMIAYIRIEAKYKV
jgi:membrane-bound ClpP family serine protease